MLGGSFSPAMGEERLRQSLSQPYIYTSCTFVPKKALVLRSIAARVLRSALFVWLYVFLTQQPTVVTKKMQSAPDTASRWAMYGLYIFCETAHRIQRCHG